MQQEMHKKKIEELILNKQNVKNKNLRLQRKVQIEVDRPEQLYKQLSENEQSLIMNDERASNNKIKSSSKHAYQTKTS
ncbi:unnamed protein product [Rotaria sp. Silwood2]|nr:unnamed protein product [Rotaria sp. Silwood2]CAF2923211.1 unnamed protein product [Rotaria sp. Silwood2]CAF3363884.1 unnamed protein product [Rotaria sp. Silwood2]CAF3440291.1 unnamed protein product [Rotaria sp. Silwood2]CAF4330968.1 unnamed protein product [Rotaria sp. Silwood2]